MIAVEQFGAGPFGSLYLADLGADVVKIEDPAVGGDVGRYIPPGNQGSDSLYFEAFNRGKRSLALDLKNGAGREVFERLVGTADAVYSNLRGDQPMSLGITYAQLAHANRKIVCVALTGYGRDGPRALLPGYDALVQAESGWAMLTGEPDGPPTKSGLPLVDYIAGLTAALGLLAGVIDARRTGRGRDIDTSLYDSALAMLSYPASWYLSSGYRSGRQSRSAHPSITPFQFFPTADGHVAVACAKEKFFRALVKTMGMPELVDDPRFASFESRLRYRSELLARLDEAFATASTQVWLKRLRGLVPVAPVRTMEAALNAEELVERGMLAEYEHPVLGTVRSVGLPLGVGGFAPEYRRAPALNEHGTALLESLGYSSLEIVDFRSRGAFGNSTQSPTHAGSSTQMSDT